MTEERRQEILAVRAALSTLRLSRITDDDILKAKGYLELWLAANDRRWVAQS